MAPPTLMTANLLAVEKMRRYRSTSFLEAMEYSRRIIASCVYPADLVSLAKNNVQH